MQWFEVFSKEIQHYQLQKIGSSVQSVALDDAPNISIADEIQKLHEIKEVRDELQILRRVSDLQATVYKSFENDLKRLTTKCPEKQEQIDPNKENNGDQKVSNNGTGNKTSGPESGKKKHHQQPKSQDRDTEYFRSAISNNVNAIKLLIEQAEEAQTAVSMIWCLVSENGNLFNLAQITPQSQTKGSQS